MTGTILSVYLMNDVSILILMICLFCHFAIIRKDGFLVYSRFVLMKKLCAAQKKDRL